MTLLKAPLVSTPTQKFVRPPCWYYVLHKIKNYGFRVVPNGIKPVTNFIQLLIEVLEFNHADRRTDRQYFPYMPSFHVRIAKSIKVRRKIVGKSLTQTITSSFI